MRRSWNVRALVILACAIATVGFGGWLLASMAALPTDGCGGMYVTEGFEVNQLPAWPTTLQKEDLIQSVGSQDVRHKLGVPWEWYNALFSTSKVPTQVEYTVVRNGKVTHVDVPWYKPPSTWIWKRNISYLFLAAVFVMSGAFITWRRGDDRAARLISWALISEALNLVINMAPAAGVNVGLSFFWVIAPLDVFSMCFTASTALHALLLFPEVKWLGRRFPRLLYAIHPLNVLISAGGGFLWEWLISHGKEISYLYVRNRAFILTYILVGTEICLGVGHLMHTYFTSRRPGVRNQIRWLIWGLVIGVSPWLLLYNIAYIIAGRPLVPLYVVIPFVGLIPLALTFSIARYNLMSIDTVINRSLVYIALTGVLVLLNSLVVRLLSGMLGIGEGEHTTEVIVLSTLTSVVTFSGVRSYLQRLIDRAFYRGRLNFERILREMGERLATTLVFENLVTLLTNYVPVRLEISRAVLLTLSPDKDAFEPHPSDGTSLSKDSPLVGKLRTEGRPLIVSQVRNAPPELESELKKLSQAEIEVCLPLRRGEKLIGIYALGRKRSGDLYDNYEVNTLILLSHQIASALENTRLYREIEEYSRTLESQVEARTRELREANQKLADTAWDLAEERTRLSTILQNIADGLVVTDLNRRVVLTNAVFEHIVGFKRKQLKDMPLRKAFPDPTLDELVAQAMAEPEQPVSKEVHFREKAVYKATASALRQGNVVTGATTVLRDITHEVEVDRMKTEFISTVSHELRTPLTSILGFAKLIHRTINRNIAPRLPPDDRTAQRSIARIVKNLDIIAHESERLTRLINNLLDIAKMEAGRIEWHMTDINIADVIADAVAGVSALAEEKHLPIHVEVPPDLPTIRGDADRLVQVVTNLLSNAIKFTDQGKITVRCWRLEAGEDIPPQGERAPNVSTGLPATVPMLVVSVTDTGIGIPSSELPKVFERFRQVGDVVTARAHGTGLGLPICREIITYHGGHIWVESTPGAGSRFLFTLPLETVEAVAETSEQVRSEIRRRIYESLPAVPAEGSTILVVDDEPSIRALLRQELTEAGYNVIEADDGAKAVELARLRTPDLILLDVMMPGLSGFDVTSVLKADERTRHIPILLLSIIEDREKGFRLGADEYLTKPVDADRLLNTIASLLRETGRERRVLVVDKDTSAVEAITQVLRERGFTVVAAYDPHGALRQAKKTRPDLVILDAMLFQENDYELLKALKYQAEQQGTSIIVLIGSSAHKKEQEGEQPEAAIVPPES